MSALARDQEGLAMARSSEDNSGKTRRRDSFFGSVLDSAGMFLFGVALCHFEHSERSEALILFIAALAISLTSAVTSAFASQSRMNSMPGGEMSK